ncbi:MAG: amidohydrolase [Defluviitaleaceae bacterium]|nr:amidohydrolase [Defluviitaleaceae bacterium]
MKYDLLFKNANIITMDKSLSKYEWVGVKDGKIATLGLGDISNAESAMAIDLEGKTILPGLMDCHSHAVAKGLCMNSVNLENVKSIEEVLSLLKAEADSKDSGEWVFGVSFLPQYVKENRYPTRYELDSICANNPLMVTAATMHGCAINTKAMDICQVPDDMPGVEKENGIPLGIYVSDESSFCAMHNALGSLPASVIWKYIKDWAENCASKGITVAHSFFGLFVKGNTDLKLVLERKAELPVEVLVFYETWKVEDAIALGLPRVGGCLTLDGSPFELTQANFEPYACDPSVRGVLYHNDSEVYNLVSKAHASNMQVTLHAVGDRAIDQLIYTYNRVIKEQGKKDLRHRIEHFCMPTQKQIEMAAEFGIILSMQPGFTYLWDKAEGGNYEYILGREKANRMDPFPQILKAGNIICAGSDSPVTMIDPLKDIAACVNGPNPIRNISVDEALKMLTVNAAYAGNLEKFKGSIEVGKDADFTIINKDPYLYANTEEIHDMEVLYTIREGKIMYQKL